METDNASQFNMRAFAESVAKELGPMWNVKPLTAIEIENGYSNRYAEIVNPETKAKLGFSQKWNDKNRVHIIGNFDNRDANNKEFWSLPYQVANPSINASIAKGAAKVAKDIETRLMPEYMPLLAKCLEAWEANGKAVSSLHSAAGNLARELGNASVRYEQYQANIGLFQTEAFFEDCVSIQVSQYPSQNTPSVRISGLDVSPAECLAIFDMLAKMRGKNL